MRLSRDDFTEMCILHSGFHVASSWLNSVLQCLVDQKFSIKTSYFLVLCRHTLFVILGNPVCYDYIYNANKVLYMQVFLM